MRTLYTFIGILMMALLGLSACTDDNNLQEIRPENQGDGFVTLSLNYESLNDKEIIVSRSAATTPEKQLYDLHFYVFDAKGNLTGYEEVLPTGDNDVIEEAQQTESIHICLKRRNHSGSAATQFMLLHISFSKSFLIKTGCPALVVAQVLALLVFRACWAFRLLV